VKQRYVTKTETKGETKGKTGTKGEEGEGSRENDCQDGGGFFLFHRELGVFPFG